MFRKRVIDEFLKSVSYRERNDLLSLHEPMVGKNCLEEVQTLSQSVLAHVLLQDLVVLADGGQKHDQENILETVDPLSTFTSLTPDINLDCERIRIKKGKKISNPLF